MMQLSLREKCPNAGNCGPEKLGIQLIFTWIVLENLKSKGNSRSCFFIFKSKLQRSRSYFFFVFLNTKNSLVHVGAPHLWLWFFCEICEIFKNIFFKKHLRVTPSVPTHAKLYLWLRQINNTMEALQTWERKLKNNGSFRLSFILLMQCAILFRLASFFIGTCFLPHCSYLQPI